MLGCHRPNTPGMRRVRRLGGCPEAGESLDPVTKLRSLNRNGNRLLVAQPASYEAEPPHLVARWDQMYGDLDVGKTSKNNCQMSEILVAKCHDVTAPRSY